MRDGREQYVSMDDAGGRGAPAVDDEHSSGLGVLLITMLALALIAVGGFVTSVGTDNPYEAEAALLIDQPQAIAATDGGEVLTKLSQLRLKYTGLVRTRAITDGIAEEVGGTPDEVAGRITAVAPPDSLLIVVRAHSDQEAEAVELAAATSQALQDYVEAEHEREGIPPADRFVLREVTPAEDAGVVDDSTRETTLRLVAVIAAIGFVVAPIVYVVRRRRAA